jgi:hypothetical protein
MVKYPHPNLQAAAAKARHADIRREAERWRLTRQGSVARVDWLSRQGCWLLCHLGRALVWLGEQLERWGSARLSPVPRPSGRP